VVFSTGPTESFHHKGVNYDNAIINATVVDPSFRIVPFGVAIVAPQRLLSINPRVDYQFNPRNTLVARYSYTGTTSENEGVGELSLPSRTIHDSIGEHVLQLTETAILGKQVVNEIRFQLVHRNIDQTGNNSEPTIRVLDSFTGGGASLSHSTNTEDRWEVTNNTTWAMQAHSLKAGVRLRHVSIADTSTQDFGGTYTFDAGFGPQLDAANQVVSDANGPVIVPLSSIESYRRTVLFQTLGLSPAAIRALGGGASQFSIATGNPLAEVSRFDFGAFLQDDWRVRRNFTLSLGLRYENQTNVSSNLNFAPRIRFGWSPGANGKGDPKTVIRGGIGVFYDRISENLTLLAERFNGDNQQQFILTNPLLLDSFPNVPSLTLFDNSDRRLTFWQVADDLRTPYTIQSALGVDQQLPHKYTLSVTFLYFRTLHALRSRNINAPIPDTVIPSLPGSGVRPLGNIGNIFQYESSGIINQHMLIVVLNNRFNKRLSVFTRYILASAKSDTDRPATLPSDSYDLTNEYGRAANDIRHRFVFGGSMTVRGGIRLNPFIIAASNRPFNIITGRDTNQDTVYAERPALATDLTKPGIITTPFGIFDPNPEPGQRLIARNFANGPAFMTVNLRLSKTFNMAKLLHLGYVPPPPQPNSGGEEEGRYRLTFAVQALNLFNRVNGGRPIGNLGSPMFGQSNSSAGLYGTTTDGIGATAGNRRIEAMLTFTF
jgi:TonB dependent receptor-like, beta-barrel